MTVYNSDRFPFGVDLKDAGLTYLEFLETVNKSTLLHQDDLLERAIWRYEHLWLPLVAGRRNSSECLAAPLDIAWVWHCHMLSPLAYTRDCVKITGRLLDHKLLSVDEREQALTFTKTLWESKYEDKEFEIFHQSEGLRQPAPNNDRSQLSCDIKAVMSRQKDFFYNVSLPHFRDKKFLNTALERYRRFLFLRKHYPVISLVPSYDIHLMWHTHLLHPNIYMCDTQKLFGRTFNYDDSVNERSPGSGLSPADSETRQVWKDMFGENFTMHGAMYRGAPPAGKFLLPADRLTEMSPKTSEFKSEKVEVEGGAENERRVKVDVSVETNDLSHSLGNRVDVASPEILKVTPGKYESVIMPEIVEQLWGPVPLPRLPVCAKKTCEVALHRLVNHLDNIEFTCRTIHSLPLLMSAIQVYYKDKLVVVGHLIGTDQLPLKSQVSEENKECVSLQTGVGERAVLIKNSEGDWGILLGRWEEFRTEIPVNNGTVGGTSEPSQTGGFLRVDFFKLSTYTWESTKTEYEAGEYEVTINGISVDLKTGFIKAPPPHEDLPENLGVAFAVALLHVLCQPHCTRPKAGSSRGGSLVPSILSEDNMVLIMAAGYNISTPTNHHLQFVHKKEHDDGCFDMPVVKSSVYSSDNFPLGVELGDAALYYLDFLEAVNKSTLLHQDDVMERAIWRYEHLWLPLAAEHQCVAAPLDIAWVWHCHMLSPLAYKRDSVTITGGFLDHKLLSAQERKQAMTFTKALWEDKYENEEFEVLACREHSPVRARNNHRSQLSYDIKAAMSRQKDFFYNVSLPHFRDKNYLAIALDRYRRFLFLRQQFPAVFLVPSYDIDLMWHTHQLHPKIYHRDTETLLGKAFNHDDSVNDRSPGSKLSRADSETRKLWKDTFDENFTMYGAMYRGAPPVGKLGVIPTDRLAQMTTKTSKITIKKLEMEGRGRHHKQMVLCIKEKINGLPRKSDRWSGKLADLDSWNSLWEGRVCQFDFDTMDLSGIHITASERVPILCFASVKRLRPVDHEMVSAVEGAYPNGGLKNEHVLFNRHNGTTLRLDLTYEIAPPKVGPVALIVKHGSYNSAIMPETVEQMWGPVPLARLPPGIDNKCQVASHRLVNHLDNVEFTCRTIHSIPLLMSAIQVYYKDKLVVVGHLIGTDQLPLKSQVSKNNKECVSLQTGVGERAVLIKNSDGDWGILSGRWEGLRKGIPGTRGTKGKRGVPGKPGSPGYLRVDFYKLSTKMWETVKTGYEKSEYEITVNGTSVNLDSGLIIAPPPHKDLPENLGVAFGVALLHVLCQPRATSGTSVSYRGDKLVRTIPSARMALVVAAGYNISTPTNHHVYALHRNGHNDDYAGCVGMEGTWTVSHKTNRDVSEDIMDYAAVYSWGNEGSGDGGRVSSVDTGGCGGCGGCRGGNGGYGGGYGGGDSGGGTSGGCGSSCGGGGGGGGGSCGGGGGSDD